MALESKNEAWNRIPLIFLQFQCIIDRKNQGEPISVKISTSPQKTASGPCTIRGNGATLSATCCTMCKRGWVGIGYERSSSLCVLSSPLCVRCKWKKHEKQRKNLFLQTSFTAYHEMVAQGYKYIGYCCSYYHTTVIRYFKYKLLLFNHPIF